MSKRSIGAVIFTAIFSALPVAAEPPGAVLAAPGDCAQPIGEFVTKSVYGQSAGVAGPASDHFAPRSPTDSVTALLPTELTRRVDTTPTGVTAGTVDVVESAVETPSEGVSGAVEATSDSVSGAIEGTVEAVDVATEGIGNVVGDVGAAAGNVTDPLVGTGTGDGIGSLGQDATGAIGDSAGAIGSIGGETLGDSAGAIGSIGGETLGGVTGTVEGATGALTNTVTSPLGGR